MTTIIDTTPAAEYIKTHGWIQGAMKRGGAVCLTGALRECDLKPGDWLIARAVYRAQEHAEGWNDDLGRTKQEVIDYLRSHPVTDDNLEEVFGPNWKSFVRLVRRVTMMSGEEVDRMRIDRSPATLGAGIAAENAVRGTSRERGALHAWDAVWCAAPYGTEYAARAAALAVIVRDLITEDEYQTLTARIRAGIGSDWEEGEL